MKLNIGSKIRELRIQRGCTQQEMAESLGVSSQAVSRWEVGSTYPDMELLPSIANFFGISIDNLFGYIDEREARINAIIRKSREWASYDTGVDINIEKCLSLLRNGLIEFPRNEKLMYELASVLANAGWVRMSENICYDTDGFLIHDVEKHHANEYWNEAVQLLETIVAESRDPHIIYSAMYDLILIYCNIGKYDKGLKLANRAPKLEHSRELLRAFGVDGSTRHKYFGEALLKLTGCFAETMVQLLISKQSNFDDDLPIHMLNGVIQMLEMLFEDGKMGYYHVLEYQLLLYLSEHQWRCGLHNEAFESLDLALEHAKRVECLRNSDEEDPIYTTKLLYGVSMHKKELPPINVISHLATDWPVWALPEYNDIWVQISSDPRWKHWLSKIQNEVEMN